MNDAVIENVSDESVEEAPDPRPDAGEAVVETGPGVDMAWLGREVVIDPTINWGHDERAQGPAFQILGLPRNGTYAELVTMPADALHDRPRSLSWEEAAAVPLAAVTTYRAHPLVIRGQLDSLESRIVRLQNYLHVPPRTIS